MNNKYLDCFDKRLEETTRILLKYPDRIPILLLPLDKVNYLIDQTKFLVPLDMTFGQFMQSMRKKTSISYEQALYFFINNKLHNPSENIYDIYKIHKNDDGFLYVEYSKENTFG